MDCCINHCRDWREMIGGLPASDHSPSCENYKPDEFSRVSLDGTSFVCEPKDLESFLSDADNPSEYKIEKVFMTRDQFEKLGEFTGF